MAIGKESPVPMILDTDTFNEIDDQFALVYALCSPEHWRVAGVTAAPFLNARSDSAGDGMRKSHDEILRILELMGCRGRIPACAGSTRFMEGKRRRWSPMPPGSSRRRPAVRTPGGRSCTSARLPR